MKKMIATLALLTAHVFAPNIANAQVQDAYIGEVRAWANNFCPRGWAHTHGQLLQISQNTALYSLLGTQFGGNGQTTFGVPDLRGRTMVGSGSGPGLSSWAIGEMQGVASNTQVPRHNHPLYASAGSADSPEPVGHAIPSHDNLTPYQTDTTKSASMAANVIGVTGESSVENRQPGITIQYCIALDGTYPQRN